MTENLNELEARVTQKNIEVHVKEAPVYDVIHPQLFNWYQQFKLKGDLGRISALMGSESSARVLDLGCGTGYLTKRVLNSWPRVVIDAVDLSPEMLAKLKSTLPANQLSRIILHQMKAQDYMANGQTQYDCIMTSALLHHLVDFKSLIKSSLCRLKSKGVLYIAYEPLKQKINNPLQYRLHSVIRDIDNYFFELKMKLKKIDVEEDHEASLADYQTLLGGIQPEDVLECLRGQGDVIDFRKFSTRAFGMMAFIADGCIRSQNTFSIIFQKK